MRIFGAQIKFDDFLAPMKTQWGKRNGCKFASDAVLRGDWVALYGLLIQGSANADCPFPVQAPVPLKLTTWARRYNSTHPNRDLVKHSLTAEITYGTPLLHQVVMAEGVDNQKSFRQGLDVLLKNGADINLQDKTNGYTALHVACMLCRSHLMEYLLSKKADRTKKDFKGKTATELMPKWCKTVVKAPQYYDPHSTNQMDDEDFDDEE